MVTAAQMVTAEQLADATWLCPDTKTVAWSGGFLRDWLRRAKIPALITKNDAEGMTALVYTAKRCYSIYVREPLPLIPNSRMSMGGIMDSRAPEPGESWTRGRDLPDGALSEETWAAILAAIVMWESVGPTERKE
jgi:hypothetical protein